MKIQKSVLKALIKECMIELFSDVINENKTYPTIKRNDSTQKQAQLIGETKNMVKCITSNPVMQDILAHTAETTLKEQLSAEKPEIDHLVSNSINNVDDIPIDDSPQSKLWSTLAFAKPSLKQ